MIVSDLDGTIAWSGKLFPPVLETMKSLGDRDIFRVVATGRSLFGARRVLGESFPIDYLVFSSGAGILDWRNQILIKQESLNLEEVTRVSSLLRERQLSFMCHDPIPENHFFFAHANRSPPEDFNRRLQRNEAHVRALPAGESGASQFVVVVEGSVAAETFEQLRTFLPDLNVIRATSPLDRSSAWLEIFPKSVSKSSASAWLASRQGVIRENVLAIGDDYNDVDLLQWAGSAAWVGEVPLEIVNGFRIFPDRATGFRDAVTSWLATPPVTA